MKLNLVIFVLFILVNILYGQDQLQSDSTKLKMPVVKLSDSWTSLDKGQHFVASMIGTILVSKINNSYFKLDNLNSKKIGIGLILSIGIGKEILDSKKINNIFSWKDIAANVVGICAGLAIMEIK